MFHWHKTKLIFPKIPHEHFSKDFTDNLLLGLLKDLEMCIRDVGELACIYQTTGHPGEKLVVSGLTLIQS